MTTDTRYFTTAILVEADVKQGGSDDLIFCIAEAKTTSRDFALVDLGYLKNWDQAGRQAKAQTLPVWYVAASGERKSYGDLFDVAAYESAAYQAYVSRVNLAREDDRHLRGPITIDEWLLFFRDAEQVAMPDSLIRWIDDPAIHNTYERYQQERDNTQPHATAQEHLERRRAQPLREEGIYQDSRGDVFKVIRSSSDRLYAKQLVDGKFEYAPGATRRLTAADKLTLEQAKQYGQLTGTCCRCGARLTDEDSITRGIGPVCATYF
jgi:hypothetical protein